MENSGHLQFYHILLIGLLIRLLLIPFFGHIDVLSEARRVYFWAENNIFFDAISRNTTMFIETIFLKMTMFLLPDREAMFLIEDLRYSTASHPHSFEFVSHSSIFRAMFILKLPFLVFDLLTAVVLYIYHRKNDVDLNCCKLWLFNPVTLFAFYVFGRFESIPVFFIAFAILALKHKRYILSALCVGLCVNGREMMIVYAPILMTAIFAEPLSRISLSQKVVSLVLIFSGVVIATQLYAPFLSNLHDTIGTEVSSIIKENRVQHLFSFQIHSIMAIPFVYALICIWVFSSKIDIHRKVLLGSGLAMMSFFAFSSHTAHFTSWMVVFPAFFIGYNNNLTRPFIAFCIVWIMYWCFLTDLGVFTLWLASPWSLHFIGIPNIPQYYSSLIGNVGHFDLKMIIYLLRSIFVATLFYMGFLMIKTITTHNEKNS